MEIVCEKKTTSIEMGLAPHNHWPCLELNHYWLHYGVIIPQQYLIFLNYSHYSHLFTNSIPMVGRYASHHSCNYPNYFHQNISHYPHHFPSIPNEPLLSQHYPLFRFIIPLLSHYYPTINTTIPINHYYSHHYNHCLFHIIPH